MWPRRFIWAAYAITALVMAVQMGLRKSVVVAVVIAPIIVAEMLLRSLAKPRLALFSKQLLALLAAHRDDELLPLWEGQRFLHFAGPDFEMFDRQGLIYAHLGDHAAAAACYRDALETAPNKRQVEIAIKLADSLRLAGTLQEAERFYREVAAVTEEHVHTNCELARLISRRQGDPEEVLTFYRRAAKHAAHDEAGGLLRAELSLALVHAGEPEEARATLEQAREDLGEQAAEHPLLAEAAEALGEAKPG